MRLVISGVFDGVACDLLAAAGGVTGRSIANTYRNSQMQGKPELSRLESRTKAQKLEGAYKCK